MSVTSSPPSPTAGPGPARRVVVWVLLVMALALLAWLLVTRGPALFSANDFVQYWSASRLNRGGGNPYDANQLLVLQRSVGWDEELALMMWNPPWAIPLVTPFGWLPYDLAHTVWVLASLVAVIVAAYLSWDIYKPQSRRHAVALVLAFLFLPTLGAINLRQISPWILLGVVGFLWAGQRGRWGLAGASAVLISIKPQLLYLFWPVLLLWCIQVRRWRPLAACAATALPLLAIAMLSNPQVLAQYIHTSIHEPPLYWKSSALGTILRLVWGQERHWLQFAPSIAGLCWVVWYWVRHRADWSWPEQLPLLLLVSVATASYGWTHDMVVLVPVLAQVAIWVRESQSRVLGTIAISLFAAINVGALVVMAVGGGSWHELWWMPWAMLVCYLVLRETTGDRLPKPPTALDTQGNQDGMS